MKNFMHHTIPALLHFEHATVIVVGLQFVFEHATSVAAIVGTLVVFVIFHVVKGDA